MAIVFAMLTTSIMIIALAVLTTFIAVIALAMLTTFTIEVSTLHEFINITFELLLKQQSLYR